MLNIKRFSQRKLSHSISSSDKSCTKMVQFIRKWKKDIIWLKKTSFCNFFFEKFLNIKKVLCNVSNKYYRIFLPMSNLIFRNGVLYSSSTVVTSIFQHAQDLHLACRVNILYFWKIPSSRIFWCSLEVRNMEAIFSDSLHDPKMPTVLISVINQPCCCNMINSGIVFSWIKCWYTLWINYIVKQK